MESVTDDRNETRESYSVVKHNVDDSTKNEGYASAVTHLEFGDNSDGMSETIERNGVVKGVLEGRGIEVEVEDHVVEGYMSDDQVGEDDKSEGTCAGKEIIDKANANLEPYVGMEFESQWAARSFYNDYAKRVGFGTRISYSHRSKRDRKMIGQQYVCVKEGFPVNKEGPSKLPRSSARIGCKASMTVKRANQGKWVVKGFEKEHNHELASPEEVQFLRSHRGISNAAVNLISNIPGLAAHLSSIINKSGANSENNNEISVTGQNSKNDKESIARDNANMVLEFFKVMQNENPSFFYAVQIGKDDRLANAFWADARSRMAYESFGDVIFFDTKYLSDKYQIPLASFIGVNHHEQPVLYGCALMTDHTKVSYNWLFKSWLAAMLGRHPISMITCHNKVIQAAVAEVFPDTNLRFCLWDIQRKVLDKLVDMTSSHENFMEEFFKCLYQPEESEFESSWSLLLDRFDLRSNDWFQSLYDDRQHWVPVYLKPTFFADMPAIPKGEPMESFFEGHLTYQTSLENFLKEYNFVIDGWLEKEVQADLQASILRMSSPMVSKVSSLYTKKIFDKFQTELLDYFNYVPNRVAEEGSMNMYVVAKYGEEKSHTVTFDFTEMRGSCNCRMFEFTGILCRHIVSVLTVEQVSMIPSHYILKRWTRNARSSAMLDECNIDVSGNSRQSMLTRYNDLCHRFIRLAEEGARSIESYSAAVRSLHATLREVTNVNDGIVGPTQPSTPVGAITQIGRTNEGNQPTNLMNMLNSQCPHQSKAKGRPSSKSKAGLEKDTRRMNTCNTCMKPGHNSRTCPTLANMDPDIIEDIQLGQLDWGMSLPSIPHARQPY